MCHLKCVGKTVNIIHNNEKFGVSWRKNRDIIKKCLPNATKNIRHNNKRGNIWVGYWDSMNESIIIE